MGSDRRTRDATLSEIDIVSCLRGDPKSAIGARLFGRPRSQPYRTGEDHSGGTKAILQTADCRPTPLRSRSSSLTCERDRPNLPLFAVVSLLVSAARRNSLPIVSLATAGAWETGSMTDAEWL